MLKKAYDAGIAAALEKFAFNMNIPTGLMQALHSPAAGRALGMAGAGALGGAIAGGMQAPDGQGLSGALKGGLVGAAGAGLGSLGYDAAKNVAMRSLPRFIG